jgi:thiosulfate dehydrogenase (quinone) large subunit
MAGLLGIGIALVLGIGLRIAAAAGALMLVFMWAASLPIKTNPFMDDHLVYAVVVIGLALTHAGDTLGLGGRWSRLSPVRRFPALR